MSLAVALPLAVAMAYFWWEALQQGRDREVALLQTKVAQVQRGLEDLRAQSEWVLSRMARRPAFRGLSPAACDDEMAVMREVNPALLLVTLWTKSGELVCSSVPPKPDQPRPQPHRKSFEAGIATDGLYLSDVFQGPITGLPLVTFTYPVRQESGETVGLLSIPVRMDFFESLLRSVEMRTGSSAGIVDRNLVLVARVPENRRWQGMSAADVAGAAVPTGDAVGTVFSPGVDGRKRIIVRATLPTTGWRVFVGVEEEVLFAASRKRLAQGIAIVAAAIALSLGLALVIGRGITRPLRHLVSVTDAVAKGDRSVRAVAAGGGEIALLADHVNRMLDTLERSEASLRESESGYRTLAESSPDAILIHQDLRIVFVNRAMVKLMRAGADGDLVGKSSMFMLTPDHADQARRRSLSLYVGEPQPSVEQVYRRLDGTPVDVEIAAAPLAFNGKPAAQVTVRDITARKQAERLLRASMARARELSARLLVAEEAERKRIAHDLHDQIGQELTALKIRVETIARTTESPATRTQLLEVAVAAGEALQQVRQMSVDLRPPQLDSLGLAATLRAHAQRLSSLGKVQVHFDSRGFQGKVPGEIEIMCFRVAQEALTNVMRHSGAENAWVELGSADGALRLSVRDDGAGFDAVQALERAGSGGGFGLLGMMERVTLVGGALDIRSQPGQGCTVTATFPVSEAVTGP